MKILSPLYERLDNVLGTNWKTYTGSIIVLLSIIADLTGYKVLASTMYNVGMSLGVIGIGHKAQRILVNMSIKYNKKE